MAVSISGRAIMSAKPVPHVPATDEERDGRFTDPVDAFPALFADPDGRGSRKWAQIFDTSRCEELKIEQLLGGLPKL